MEILLEHYMSVCHNTVVRNFTIERHRERINWNLSDSGAGTALRRQRFFLGGRHFL